MAYCEPSLTPREPLPIAHCERCGCGIYSIDIGRTSPSVWNDQKGGLICEDCVTEEEKEYLYKVG